MWAKPPIPPPTEKQLAQERAERITNRAERLLLALLPLSHKQEKTWAEVVFDVMEISELFESRCEMLRWRNR